MRGISPLRLALALALGASGGCNAIFGLSATHQQDAEEQEAGEGPGLDSSVERLVALSNFTYDNSTGAPADATLDTSPLAPDPGVKIGLLTDVDLSALPLPYADGVVHISRAFDFKDWRFVATIDGLVQEWQWQIGDGAHVTGEIGPRNPAQPAVPVASYFEWKVDPGVGPVADLLVTTTGGWHHDRFTSGVPQTFTTYDWTPPMTPGSIAPTTDHHDAEIITSENPPDGTYGCLFPKAVGYESVDLVAHGPSNTTTTAWSTTPPNPARWIGPSFLPSSNAMRLNALTTRNQLVSTWQQAGYVVHGSVPSFPRVTRDLRHTAGGPPERGNLRHPEMIDILSCTDVGTNAQLSFVEPPAAAMLDTKMDMVWFAEATSTRGSKIDMNNNNTEITSALQVIAKVPANNPSVAMTLTFATPMVHDVKIDTLGLETANGSGDGDFAQTLTVGAHRLIPLTWMYEQGQDIATTPDDMTIIVYGYKKPSTIQLTPLRAIHVRGTATSAMIDSDVFAGASYDGFLFELVGRNGSNADRINAGDYTAITYPLSQASVFTYAFKVQP